MKILLTLLFATNPVWLYNHDGDTITYLNAAGAHVTGRIRYIDAPEVKAPGHWPQQPYALEASVALEAAMIYKRPQIIDKGTDKYRRTLVDLSEDIQRYLVYEGYAWAYGSKFKKEQALAIKAKRGLWGGKCIVEPKDWRKGKRCPAQ